MTRRPLGSFAMTSPLIDARNRVQTRARLNAPFSSEDLDRFREICSQQTDPAHYPHSKAIAKNAVIYDGDELRSILLQSPTDGANELMNELHHCLLHGPGVYVVKNCYPDHQTLKRTNEIFETIIEREKQTFGSKGDHFAAAGTNDRIWNSYQKHAEIDPDSFVKYYSNEVLALACEAWLGPGYQITAQTNIVKPGGKAQSPHRDYHLGFQSETVASQFPIVSQISSQLLTLQLAIAHSDMPISSGPTKLLPFSQQFDYGYIAYRHPDFTEIFDRSMIQLPLSFGDAVFFNPALFHAAGDNISADIRRSANLLQVSACWSKPMEAVDRSAVLRRVWPAVKQFAEEERHPHHLQTRALLNALCDGYSFPTNLDKDPPPPNGHCPPTQIEEITEGLRSGWSQEELEASLTSGATKRLA